MYFKTTEVDKLQQKSHLFGPDEETKISLTNELLPYLDADGSFSHPDKVLPLQQGSEALLQRDDESEDFPVEQGLEPLARRLTQENLRGGTTADLIKSYIHTQGLKCLNKDSQVCSLLSLITLTS